MAEKPKYYWDACAWIALIQQEEGRFDSLKYVTEQAKDAKSVELWTSMFTLAEVYKRPCDGEQKSLLPVHDGTFEDYILQDFVTRVQVDFDVGRLARTLLRQYPTIGKPQDAIHVATALLYNIDELHTFDRANLTALSGKIARKDGKMLTIGAPPKRPKPVEPPKPELLRRMEDETNETEPKRAEGGGGK